MVLKEGSITLRVRVFILSYITYAAYYLTRLNLSVALPSIAVDLGYPKLMLGLMGGIFSAVYALGQLINGQLADWFGAKKLVTVGLLLSATVNILFGLTETGTVMVLLWAVNGYAQSTGWPSIVKIVGEWFDEGSRGKVGGLFGTCFLVGSMTALALSGYILTKFNWRAAFFLPSIILFVLVSLFNIVVKEKKSTSEGEGCELTLDCGFRRLILSRKILTIAAAYVLLQFVRSGLNLWAPSYLFEIHGMPLEYASYAAAMVPLGGIIGSILSGWFSDKFNGSRRIPVVTAMTLSLGFITLLLHRSVEFGLMTCVTLLFLGGLALYGPHVIMSTIIPMEYTSHHRASTVAGFIDGLGYIGTTFADPFIGWVVDSRGWGGALTFWTISAFSATLLTSTLWRSEK
ncbi:MAG: MFS transporter [Candidatus Bathyarchaeia archaeon]